VETLPIVAITAASPSASVAGTGGNRKMPTLISRLIRNEQPADLDSIRAVNEAAFGRAGEADLIDRLRSEGATLLSLVAEQNGQIVGHILFSRMHIDTHTARSPPSPWLQWPSYPNIRAAKSAAN
jgi:hypothetical protein